MIYRIFRSRKPKRPGAGVYFESGGAMRHTGVFVLAALVLTSVPGWSQTTTGRLMGTTVDEDGAVLPGIGVTISSPALIGGAQVKTTDDRGEFLFLALGPGTYSVKAESSGFVTQERNLIEVPLGGAAAITIAMPMGTFAGEIEVVDLTPVVDPTQVNAGQIFRADYMRNSAIGSGNRAYTTVIRQTAGALGAEPGLRSPSPRFWDRPLAKTPFSSMAWTPQTR